MSSTATQSQRTCRPNSECLSSPQSRGGICVSQAGVLNMTTCHAGRLTRRERQPTLTQEVVRDPELARQRKRRYHRLQVGSHITWLLVGLMIPPGGQHAPHNVCTDAEVLWELHTPSRQQAGVHVPLCG